MGIFSGFWRQRDVLRAVESVLDSRLRETVTSLQSLDELVDQKAELLEELDNIRRAHDGLAADIAIERRDIEHKLGLESLRQKQEAEMAALELASQKKLMAEEKRVAIDQARLEAKIEATEEARRQMAEFQNRQERMIGQLMDALPKATHFHRTGGS